MSSTPMLPISVHAQPTYESKSSAVFAVLYSSLTRLLISIDQALSHGRPWIELIDLANFCRPASFSNATSRTRKNLTYFRVNYLAVLAAVMALSLVSHPFSILILLSLIFAWLCFYALRPSDKPVVIAGRTFSEMETLGMLVAYTVVVIFFTSVGPLLVWGITVGMGIVCTHAAFRVPEDLFLDDQESSSLGLFSFISKVASSAAIAATPATDSRV